MPQSRRTSLGRRTRNTASQRNLRANQTEEQRDARNELERNRHRDRNVVFNPHRAAFSYNVAIDYSSEQIVAIGLMNIVCPHCKALKFKNEAPGLCCASGQVKLTPLVPPPEPLHSLLSGIGPDSSHFLTHIQQYNNCFQMTSFGATKVIRDNFMPTFKIQGQIYHLTGSLLPVPDKDYKFLQIYFMGNSAREVDQRCAHNNSVKRSIVEQLQTFFHQHNELVALFKTACHQIITKLSSEPIRCLQDNMLDVLMRQPLMKRLASDFQKLISI